MTITTGELLDRAKAKLSLRSDYALAKYLGVTTASMTRWRSGHSFGDDNAIRVADILGMNRAYVLACIAAERAEDDGEASGVWRQIADAFKSNAAALACIAVLSFPGFADTAHADARELPARNTVYYGKSPRVRPERRRRRRNGLTTVFRQLAA